MTTQAVSLIPVNRHCTEQTIIQRLNKLLDVPPLIGLPLGYDYNQPLNFPPLIGLSLGYDYDQPLVSPPLIGLPLGYDYNQVLDLSSLLIPTLRCD